MYIYMYICKRRCTLAAVDTSLLFNQPPGSLRLFSVPHGQCLKLPTLSRCLGATITEQSKYWDNGIPVCSVCW